MFDQENKSVFANITVDKNAKLGDSIHLIGLQSDEISICQKDLIDYCKMEFLKANNGEMPYPVHLIHKPSRRNINGQT